MNQERLSTPPNYKKIMSFSRLNKLLATKCTYQKNSILAVDFLVHLTTYGPPNHSGGISVSGVFSPIMWEPKGMPLGEISADQLVSAHR